MASLYPREPTVDRPDPDTPVLDLTEEASGTVLDALSAATSRAILARLDTEPAPASELAEELGTSLQNVQYHVGKLEEAGLVEQAGTWYSERGTAMRVYAPTVARFTVRLDGADPDVGAE